MNINSVQKESLVAEYINKAQAGMDISEIRKELQLKNIPEAEIRGIIWSVDNYIVRNAVAKSNIITSKEYFWMGIVLITTGSLLTLGTVTGLINLGNMIIIAYGPIIGGIFMLTRSRIVRRSRKPH